MYKEIDVEETRMPKWAAAADAQQKNRDNRKLWTAEQQQQLEGLYLYASRVYNARVFYNYREKFMVVKVEKPSKGNLLSTDVREFDYWAAQQNIDIVRTKNNILYRINREAA